MENIISTAPLRALISMQAGQNYWLNACMQYLMECLGESKNYSYWLFSGVTGDSFIQLYNKNPHEMPICFSHQYTAAALKKAFHACGYGYDHISNIDCEGKRSKHSARIRGYIDNGVPVIARVNGPFNAFGVICAYKGDRFYCLLGESPQLAECCFSELVFVGEKMQKPPVSEIYRKAVLAFPSLIAMEGTNKSSFGKQAFVDWAQSFQSGLFGNYADGDPIWHTHPYEGFTCWNMHGAYLCMLGTNACCESFLAQTLELNPDMAFIGDLIPIVRKQTKEGFDALAKMEGGFGILPSTVRDKAKMEPISNKIAELSLLCDDILSVFSKAGYEGGAN